MGASVTYLGNLSQYNNTGCEISKNVEKKLIGKRYKILNVNFQWSLVWKFNFAFDSIR